MQAPHILIVGQGLAGSILAFELVKYTTNISIIDSANPNASSQAAAGLYNPITGMRFVKTWLADEIYPNILSYYKAIEQVIGSEIIEPMPIFRPLNSVKQQNEIIELCEKPEVKQFAKYSKIPNQMAGNFESRYGGLKTELSGWVNVPKLLQKLKTYFQENTSYKTEQFDYTKIIFHEKNVEYLGKLYDQIIFCEGYESVNNPYFNWLPFNAVKGETLRVKANFGIKNYVLLKGIFVLPVGDDEYIVGSTYNWTDKAPQPTEQGKAEIINKIEQLIDKPFEILSHKAGIRPATTDRRPFVGLHPAYNCLGIFNGFGTKGVSICPYLAQNFSEFLLKNKELLTEANINRFSSLYLMS